MIDVSAAVQELAATLVLGELLNETRRRWGAYKVVDHWQQGEFHHDTVLQVDSKGDLPGGYLVVATNCNGGVKEVLLLDRRPVRGGLWKARCPENPEFEGLLPLVRERSTTPHWFDPCALLRPDARSEYREEFRARQPGGGWIQKPE